MSKGDFAAWAQQVMRGQRTVMRAAAARQTAPTPNQPPVLVTPFGQPIAPPPAQPLVMPPGTIPWGVGTQGQPAQTVRGHVPPRPPAPVYTMHPRSTVLMNKDDGRDTWAERIAQLPELVQSDGSDAMRGQYSDAAMVALRGAAGASGGTHDVHTLRQDGSIAATQKIGDMPVPIGMMMGPTEYGQATMPMGRALPLQPGTVMPAAQPAPPMPAPSDPMLESIGMMPAASPPLAVPIPGVTTTSDSPAVQPGPTAPSTSAQLSLL